MAAAGVVIEERVANRLTGLAGQLGAELRLPQPPSLSPPPRLGPDARTVSNPRSESPFTIFFPSG